MILANLEKVYLERRRSSNGTSMVYCKFHQQYIFENLVLYSHSVSYYCYLFLLQRRVSSDETNIKCYNSRFGHYLMFSIVYDLSDIWLVYLTYQPVSHLFRSKTMIQTTLVQQCNISFRRSRFAFHHYLVDKLSVAYWVRFNGLSLSPKFRTSVPRVETLKAATLEIKFSAITSTFQSQHWCVSMHTIRDLGETTKCYSLSRSDGRYSFDKITVGKYQCCLGNTF